MGFSWPAVISGSALLWIELVVIRHLVRGVQGIPPALGVIGVGCAAAVTGSLAALLGLGALPLALAIGVGIVVCSLNPAGAMVVLTALLLIRPWELPGIEGRLGWVPRSFALLAVGSAALEIVRRPGAGIYWCSGTAVYLGAIAWFIGATAISSSPAYLATVELGNFFPLTVVFLLLPTVLDSPDKVELARRAIVIGVTGAVGAAFASPPALSLHGEVIDRLNGSGLFGNSNDLAALITIALPLLVVPVWGKWGKWFSPAFLAPLGVMLVGLWLTQSRGAVIAIGVGGGVFALGCLRSRWSIVVVTLLGAALAAFFSLVHRDAEDLDTSSTSRFSYAIAGARMARAHPVFGVGMENYPRRYEQYTPSFAEWGERTAHSSWVLAVAETGIPGLLLFGGLYLLGLRSAWRIRAKSPAYVVSVSAYGVAMSFLSHTYTLLPYLVTAVAFAANRASAEAQEVKRESCGRPAVRDTVPWRTGIRPSKSPS